MPFVMAIPSGAVLSAMAPCNVTTMGLLMPPEVQVHGAGGARRKLSFPTDDTNQSVGPPGYGSGMVKIPNGVGVNVAASGAPSIAKMRKSAGAGIDPGGVIRI